ncbi:hypothetical protein PUN28_011627 [Cardiocondyla obscurior]|uniref:Uncharacterized protein n=1 Tax=Cardiocondyla obscurior TaxID=286306 RepID=A0AAW2FHE6_9HYME
MKLDLTVFHQILKDVRYDRKGVKIRRYFGKCSASALYILNNWTIDFHLIAIPIVHTSRVNFSRFEKSRRRNKVAWKMARLLAQLTAVCPALLRALRALNPYFSQRLRVRLAPTSHLRMAKRHGRRASRSRRRGYQRPLTENRQRGEQSRPFAGHNGRRR